MKDIILPSNYNYIAVFLTFRCNLNCSYCINKYGKLGKRNELSGKDWINGLNRIKTNSELPITISGGEPTLHQDFYEIIEGIDKTTPIDLLTNLQFSIKEFTAKVDPKRLQRQAKYASIRVSYHPNRHKYETLLTQVRYLMNKGYSIGIWGVDHPDYSEHVKYVQYEAQNLGIDFRIKEFLGWHMGELYGTYRYPHALLGNKAPVLCKTSELLIGPDGNIYRCHRDLYSNSNIIGNILSSEDLPLNTFMRCNKYGDCNPCDIKAKFNRFQELGHCSVEIEEIDPSAKA